MSYSNRGLGASVTCNDGSVIDVPAGGNANALCLAHHASSTANQTATDVANIVGASGSAIASIIGAFQTPSTSTTPTAPAPAPAPDFTLPAPAPSTMPGWVIPAAVGGGILLIGGILFLGKKKHATAAVTANKRRGSKKRHSKRRSSRRNGLFDTFKKFEKGDAVEVGLPVEIIGEDGKTAKRTTQLVRGFVNGFDPDEGSYSLDVLARQDIDDGSWSHLSGRSRAFFKPGLGTSVRRISAGDMKPNRRHSRRSSRRNPRRRVSIKAKARTRRTRRAIKRAIWATPLQPYGRPAPVKSGYGI